MKRRFTSFVLTTGLSVLLGSPMVSAQSQSEVAEIPFAFHASSSMLPAGTYTVDRAASTGVTRLSDTRGRGIFIATQGATLSKEADPRLTFACYGQDCVLTQIWTADGLGYDVVRSHKDSELTRKLGVAAQLRTVHLGRR